MGLQFRVSPQVDNMVAFQIPLVTLFLASALAAPQLTVDPTLNIALEDEEPFNPNPQYAYAYQVADDDQQTYIAHQEERDGVDVTGEYSYVDPLGNLVVVKYTAGVMGYTETREVQPNFVEIRRRQSVSVAAPAPAPVRAPAPAPAPVRQVVQQVRPVVQQAVQQQTSSSSSSSNDSDLVARIIAQLTPFIRNTVTTSLGSSSSSGGSSSGTSQSSTTTTTTTTSSGSGIQNIFGVQGENNARVNTPDFNFAYD